MMSTSAARRILLPIYHALVRRQEKAVTAAAKLGQFTVGETGKSQFVLPNSFRKMEEWINSRKT